MNLKVFMFIAIAFFNIFQAGGMSIVDHESDENENEIPEHTESSGYVLQFIRALGGVLEMYTSAVSITSDIYDEISDGFINQTDSTLENLNAQILNASNILQEQANRTNSDISDCIPEDPESLLSYRLFDLSSCVLQEVLNSELVASVRKVILDVTPPFSNAVKKVFSSCLSKECVTKAAKEIQDDIATTVEKLGFLKEVLVQSFKKSSINASLCAKNKFSEMEKEAQAIIENMQNCVADKQQ